MELDRKTQRELNRLTHEAQRLWEEQRDVLSHAKDVAREASRQATDITKREVLPRAQSKYRETVEPLVARVPWKKAPAVPEKNSHPLVYVLMAIGAIAVAAISYAAWQTLRADDDLWVEEDEAS
jgi:ABC-type transporter Mla subunit MlaD